MSLRCGIVGLPNVGKSTIFNAVTRAQAQSANFPFCTIEPNVARVEIPDSRLDKITQIVKPKQKIYTTTEFVDIAGLVEGASKGEGLGNKFLSHIRETQAIAHVVRCFEDDDVVHVKGKCKPEDDIEIINLELILADLESLSKQIDKIKKKARSGEKEAKALLEVGEKILVNLEEGKVARSVELDSIEKKISKAFQLITQKSLFYVCNVDENSIQKGNELVKKVEDIAKQENVSLVLISGKMEEELIELTAEEQKEYLDSLGLSASGLEKMIHTSYTLLNLITFFTAGEEEVRAWTTPKDSLAPQAAGQIHTDIEHGFIRAEITSYSDFIKYGSLLLAKENGKMRLEGKDYVIQDGDIAHFRFNN